MNLVTLDFGHIVIATYPCCNSEVVVAIRLNIVVVFI